MRARLGIFLLLLTTVVVPLSGRSVPVVWTLSGVTFADGGTASGTFTYDAGTNTYSAVAITTTPGSVRSGATYAFSLGISGATFLLATTVNPAIDQTGLPALLLVYATPLTNAGGTVSLVSPSQEASCADAGCANPPSTPRFTTSGSVTTLTVPMMPPWFVIATTLLLSMFAISTLRRRASALA